MVGSDIIDEYQAEEGDDGRIECRLHLKFVSGLVVENEGFVYRSGESLEVVRVKVLVSNARIKGREKMRETVKSQKSRARAINY